MGAVIGEHHTGRGGLLRLSVRHLFLLVPWVGLVIGASRPIRDNSFLWHVRAGELQLESGEVLRSDPFSFTFAGRPWRTQSWIADLLYARLEGATGDLGWVPWLLIVCGGLLLLTVGSATYRRLRSPFPVSIALIVLLWIGLPNLVPRPVIFSFVLLALLVIALEAGSAWAAPLILWVWGGLHGSFVIGLGLLVLDAFRRRASWRRAAVRVGISLAAVSLTAHGLAIWGILGGFLRNRAALSYITEWGSPDFLSLAMFPYVLLLAALIVAAAMGRLAMRDLWVVIPFAAFGLTSARAVFPAAIVLIPYAAMSMRRRTSPPAAPAGRSLVNSVLAGALFIVPLALVWDFGGIDHDRFPVEAARHLSVGPTWHDDATGGYLIFERGPAFKVFVDDRAELYGAEFFEEFIKSRRGSPEWRSVFERHEIGEALVDRDSGLATVLADEGWRRAYEDANWIVFVAP